MKKRIGDPITLTRHWWDAPEPRIGDILRTSTGRQYVILEVKQNRLKCIVANKNETTKGMVFEWKWGRRLKRKQ